MDRYTNFILKHRKIIIFLFVTLAAICMCLSGFVGVNYNFADYLPDDAKSTKAIHIMEEEYKQAIPNLRVMIRDASIADALYYKEKIAAVDGVDEINWLDDAVNIYAALETLPEKTVNEWYKNENALFSVTVDEEKETEAIENIRDVIGDENYMTGTAVTDVYSPINTTKEVNKITVIVIFVVLIILLLTTTSWFEPFLFLFTIGIAVALNRGTNLMFGEISFVTNAAGSVLQLAVSMDYSIFLLHRFSENRFKGKDVQEAMVLAVKQSVSSILSSGLTTVTGFAALILMRFKIGPDMGWVMVKAICLSLLSVLCLLPVLAITTYKWIDKTQHRAFVPSFEKAAKVVMKIKIPVLIVFFLLVIPSFRAQSQNDFLYGSGKIYSTEQTQIGRDMIAIENVYGSSNPVVLMVPKGDMEKERALNEDLLKMSSVTSVISYINTVGSEIPQEFIPSEELSKLYSRNYSRFVVTLDKGEGMDGWEQQIKELRALGEKYYGDKTYLAGDLVSTEDLKTTITQDNEKVNLLALGFVFLILLVNFKSISLPVILTAVIEASIWINLAVPYFTSASLHYIGYLIISSVQLGATIDYAILLSSRYMEERKKCEKWEAAAKAVSHCMLSILTSAGILMMAGIILGAISTNMVLSQLGILLGRGAVLSFFLVIFVLPIFLGIFDGLIRRTTIGTDFYEKEEELL